ncbi:hypothetical protein HYV74_02995 [Candidatus Uhrbacteria bacterium]|nr:hypothetical protein [Candidatus Uhrbacteria bacterium]
MTTAPTTIDFQKFRLLPVEVQAAITGPQAIEQMEEIEEDFGVSLMTPLVRFACGEMRWSDFPVELVSQGIELSRAREIADAVLRRMLANVIQKIDPTAVPPVVRLAEVMREIGDVIPVEMMSGRVEERIRHAVGLYLREVRDEMETNEFLHRSVKIGGAELSDDHTDAVLRILRKYHGATLVPDDATPQLLETIEPLKAAGDETLLTRAEVEEVTTVQVEESASRAAITAAVDRVLQRTGARFKSAEAEQRFRKTVEAGIRGVRSNRETRDLLVRPKPEGGLGIPSQYVDQVMKILEEEARAVRGVHASKGKPIHEPPPGLPVVAVAQEAAVVEPAPTTPIPELRLTRSAPSPSVPEPAPERAMVSPPAALPVVSVAPAPFTPPSPPLPIGNPRKDVGATLRGRPPAEVQQPPTVASAPPPPPPPPPAPPMAPPGSMVPAVMPVPEPPPPPPVAPPVAAPPIVSVPRPIVPPAPVVAPPSYRPPMSGMAAVPTVTASGRPKVQEIRAVPPRLVGPIEELSRLTVSDLRKIAKTPSAAAQKIIEKIALLEKDGNTKRAEGIRALRMSPLFLLYADILNAALTAKHTLAEEANARHGGDPSSLTVEELQEIGNMNRALRV